MTTRHPELAAEQKVIEHSHDCHEAAIAEQQAIVAGSRNGGADALSRRGIREKAIGRLGQLKGVDTSRLVVGRLDFKDEDRGSIYIGPCTVMDGGKVAVVDFTRPVARGFYYASENDPLGLMRRRSFDVLGRELRDINDEVFGVLPPRLRGEADGPPTPERTVLDRVAGELERAREPRMRDIVASIVADQYRMIEAPHEGLFIVQGGPGTGKTAVALHRAVFLLRNNEDLGKVLVVGPNAAFMAFIAQVLPGLGETTVDQIAIGRLADTGDAQPQGQDGSDVATLKGDARMAVVIERALRQRIRPTQDSPAIRYEGQSIRMTPDEANAVLDRELARDRPYMEGRRRFIDAMRSAIEELVQTRITRGLRRRSVDRAALQRQLANDGSWRNVLERMWPTASAAQAIHDLLTTEQRLRTAAEGILDGAEIDILLRRGVRTVGVHPWSMSDMPLIDEAQALVQGPAGSYGYVIVDEAQDLTPMELRMVARRSRMGDLTLVGDMAQATGPFRYKSWEELAQHLPTERGVRQDELRIGYRVPRSIMELANLLLPQVAPGLRPTEPVREARVDPRFEQTSHADLADLVAITVADLADDERSVGVIVPETHLVAVRGALASGGISVGDISTDQLEKRTTLLTSAESKGLEFDRVVLVEPWDIVTSSPAGWSELYVALSRATQQLVIAHAEPLPAPLPGGVTPIVADAASGVADGEDVSVTGGDSLDLELDLELDLDLDSVAGVAPPLQVSESLQAARAEADAGAGGKEQELVVGEEQELVVGDEQELVVGDEQELVAGDEQELVAADEQEPVAEPHVADPSAARAIGELAAVPKSGAGLSIDGPAGPPVTNGTRKHDAALARSARTRPAPPRLSGDFSEALVFAKLMHDGRSRRGTAVPYLGHLLGTAALVLEDGGNEAEVIAALLHDAVEDGTPEIAETIRRRFGDVVAEIVIGCTDPLVPDSFRDSKEQHFKELESGSTSVRRVALAEKLDNARALLRDLERYGGDTWKRMDVDRDELLWYLRNLVALFRRTFPSVLSVEFGEVVERIEALAES